MATSWLSHKYVAHCSAVVGVQLLEKLLSLSITVHANYLPSPLQNQFIASVSHVGLT